MSSFFFALFPFLPIAHKINALLVQCLERLDERAWGRLLHQSLEGGMGFADLGEARLRTRKIRKEFLVFVNCLVVLAGTFVELSEIVMRHYFSQGESLGQGTEIRHVMLDPHYGAKLGLGRRIVIDQEM